MYNMSSTMVADTREVLALFEKGGHYRETDQLVPHLTEFIDQPTPSKIKRSARMRQEVAQLRLALRVAFAPANGEEAEYAERLNNTLDRIASIYDVQNERYAKQSGSTLVRLAATETKSSLSDLFIEISNMFSSDAIEQQDRDLHQALVSLEQDPTKLDNAMSMRIGIALQNMLNNAMQADDVSLLSRGMRRMEPDSRLAQMQTSLTMLAKELESLQGQGTSFLDPAVDSPDIDASEKVANEYLSLINTNTADIVNSDKPLEAIQKAIAAVKLTGRKHNFGVHRRGAKPEEVAFSKRALELIKQSADIESFLQQLVAASANNTPVDDVPAADTLVDDRSLSDVVGDPIADDVPPAGDEAEEVLDDLEDTTHIDDVAQTVIAPQDALSQLAAYRPELSEDYLKTTPDPMATFLHQAEDLVKNYPQTEELPKIQALLGVAKNYVAQLVVSTPEAPETISRRKSGRPKGSKNKSVAPALVEEVNQPSVETNEYVEDADEPLVEPIIDTPESINSVTQNLQQMNTQPTKSHPWKKWWLPLAIGAAGIAGYNSLHNAPSVPVNDVVQMHSRLQQQAENDGSPAGAQARKLLQSVPKPEAAPQPAISTDRLKAEYGGNLEKSNQALEEYLQKSVKK